MTLQAIDLNSLPPDVKIGNDEGIEKRWAEMAVRYTSTIEKLLVAAGRRSLDHLHRFRFTPIDNDIYKKFRMIFPDMDVCRLDIAKLKSPEEKQKWYFILESWKTVLKEYDMGTLIRIDAEKPFGPTNSCVVPRSQFYCIEIARCREAINDKYVLDVIEERQELTNFDD